ncbi:serine--tRNA ligase [Candidatus Riesia pediculischaeffi]|uniref:serine--tRNA ligase n=1 Tax=Candidatus Riesia pediculischaeffi TaxID=428411 RepID=UPI000584B6F3|nr:serine--tRNA ligase [Candidatus Riesia pediculischaeffi]
MLDPKMFFSNLKIVKQKLSARGFHLDSEKIVRLKRRETDLIKEIDFLRRRRNHFSKIIGIEKIQARSVDDLHIKAKKIREELSNRETQLKSIKEEIQGIFSEIPNLPEECFKKQDNIEIKRWGKKRKFDFKIRNHIELTKENRSINFTIASKISKSKFSVISGKLAQLYRALSQFMISLHVDKHNYYEVLVPYLVNYRSLYNTGHLPKFTKDLFSVKLNDDSNKKNKYFLIPTGEVPVVNLVQNKVFSYESLPIKLVSHTACFRSEAGSYGNKTHGLIRLHQFDKVELIRIVHPKRSVVALERLTENAEKVLQLLNLPYRKIMIHNKNLGFSSSKTYDLEVWIPSRQKYIEISSCSNTTDFQSRRMNTKFKKADDRKEFVHILNGSGLPIGRTMVAILENYQSHDGSIEIPKILQKYMNGMDRIFLEKSKI